MKTLKFTMVFAMLLCACTFAVAQDDDLKYLGAVVRFLDEGNCSKADLNYDIYKKQAGKTSASIERLISECKGANGVSANGTKQIQINYQDYEVLPMDLDDTYTGDDAKAACDNLTAFGKSDWRLPTKEELNGMYLKREVVGGFKDGKYWSSSAYPDYSSYIWITDFEDGRQSNSLKNSVNYRYYVRCIRKK